ncbi:beta-propeller domain-containing protein [Patescibacteria group bacterium]
MDAARNAQLDKFIKERKKLGYSNKRIVEELSSAGWKRDEIKEHISDIEYRPSGPSSKIAPNYSVVTTYILVILMLIAGVGGVWWVVQDVAGFPWGNSNTNSSGYTSPLFSTLSEQLAAQSSLKKFNNYEEINDYLERTVGLDYYDSYSGFEMQRSISVDEMALPMAEFDLGVSDLSYGGVTDYSTTNIQVEGVDEADIIKTDGENVYVVSKENVFIIDAYPAGNAKILSTIALQSTPQDIYINGDFLVIYGHDDDIYSRPVFDDLPHTSTNYTYLKVFNIKDRSNPKQVRDLDFEGTFANSRMIGDYVYFVTSQYAYVYDDAPLPLTIEDDELLPTDPGVSGCLCPDVYYIDVPYYDYSFTTVTAINIRDNDEDISSEVYLLDNSENMYVSQENIYLVYTKYVSDIQLSFEVMKEMVFSDLSAKNQQRIIDIEAAPSHVLSEGEKISKVYSIVSRYIESLSSDEQDEFQESLEDRMMKKYDDISKELEKTVIHKISIDKGDLEYEGSGEVTGHVLNQFSMDERDGYFRIATTKGRTWSSFSFGGSSTESYSNVYVLDGDLDVVGKVENLAKDEEIYSARFMQGRVYLVTFRQTDPLFAIDLTNPKNPKVLGELKVPGFSSYLHPYDDNYLIGMGKQADDNGIITSLKVSLFDVSDVENMKEVDTYEMGGRWSDSLALDDHKAFLFSKNKNLLVIPVTLRKETATNSYGDVETNGAMVFTITKDGFELKGRIDHSDGSSDDNLLDYDSYYSYYETSVKRSMYIEDVLYTLSNKYLMMNALGDLEEIKTITLTPGEGDDFTIIR